MSSFNKLKVGKYEIIGKIAEGGMGAIYKAYDTNLDISVAVKENFLSTAEAIRQFKQEALILARLHRRKAMGPDERQRSGGEGNGSRYHRRSNPEHSE